MLNKTNRLQSISLGFACALAIGCSSNRMTVQKPPTPNLPSPQQSVSVPGTSEVAKGDELRHPATVFVAYARWQEQQKQLPQARDSFNKALQHDPRSVDALLGLSRLDRLAGRNAEAEQHLAQAEKMRPGDPLISAAWGEHFAATGHWDRAIARYRVAVEQSPDEPLYKHQLAVALTRSGKPAEGLEMFAQVVNPAEAHYNVGYLLQGQGKLMEAEVEYQRALALNPQLVQASNMLTKVRQQRGVPDTQLAGRSRPAAQPTAAVQPTAPNAAQTAVWQAQSSGGSAVSQVQPASSEAAMTSPAMSGFTSAQEEQRRNQQFELPMR